MQTKSRLAIAIAALTLSTAPVFASDALDDTAITGKVKSALMVDPDAKAYQIDVETKDGIVQLNGFVDSETGRKAASAAASGVSGVKSVDNNLEVRVAERSSGEVIDDSSLTAKVKTALVDDPTTKATDINVDTRDGTVQLNGFVETQTAKSRAGEIAHGIEGVRNVQNNLTVRL